jgi:hypothetical protein
MDLDRPSPSILCTGRTAIHLDLLPHFLPQLRRAYHHHTQLSNSWQEMKDFLPARPDEEELVRRLGAEEMDCQIAFVAG